MHALILAGGKGTRLRPLTDRRPKPLVPFMGAPFAVGLLRRLHDAGCPRVTFLVGASAEPFAPLHAVGARLGVEVRVRTEEAPLDTAGAARRVVAAEGRRVLVCNGDILTDLDYRALVAAHEHGGRVATIALTRVDDPSSFGVVTTDASGRVTAFVEKPAPGTAPTDTVNAGTYVLEPDVFTGCGGDGPLSFEREVFPRALAGDAGLGAASFDAYWSDLGTPERYRTGHAAVLEGRCSWPWPAGLALSARGAAVHRTADVAPTAEVSRGTVVGDRAVVADGAALRGAVLLDGARVGEGALVEASVLGEGAELGAGAHAVGDTVVGDHASVAAGVRLPPGCRVPAGERVRAATGPGGASPRRASP